MDGGGDKVMAAGCLRSHPATCGFCDDRSRGAGLWPAGCGPRLTGLGWGWGRRSWHQSASLRARSLTGALQGFRVSVSCLRNLSLFLEMCGLARAFALMGRSVGFAR